MKFGLQLSPYPQLERTSLWDCVQTTAKIADESAFDSLWLYDHFLYEGGYSAHPFSEPVMECLTTLGAIAAVTKRIRLGPLVLGVPYRNPALVGKIATTLDLISRGRVILGLGAGWHEREHMAYGWGELEPVYVRMKRLEEAVQVILALWAQEPTEFCGAYYRLEKVLEDPRPVQIPHPPILIGGSGEKVTLRLVARFGQFCNILSGDPATVQRRFNVLRDHCQSVERPYEEITRSIFASVILGKDDHEVARKREQLRDYVPWDGGISLFGTPGQLIDSFHAYAEAGCQYVIIRMPDWSDPDSVIDFSNTVIPAMART